MKQLFKKVTEKTLDVLYPNSAACPSCGRVMLTGEEVVCGKCWPNVFAPVLYRCEACGRPLKGGVLCDGCYERSYAYDKGYALMPFNKHTDHLIYNIKYGNDKQLAVKLGALLCRQLLEDTTLLNQVDFIVPVPISPNRLRQRGYNQADFIADGFVCETGLMKRSDILIKTDRAKDQIGLGKQARMANISGSIQVVYKNAIMGKNILVIDDVLTTGATLDECAKVLKNEGANQVFFAVLAARSY
jgi:ComF family protein